MTTPSSEDKTVAEAMPFDAFQIRSFTARASSVGDAHELSGDSIYEFARMLWGAFVAHNRAALAASGSKGGDASVERACLSAWNASKYATSADDAVHPMYLTAFTDGYRAAAPAEQSAAMPEGQMPVTDEMVSRFLGWRLPDDFGPDCGISFDGRKDDEWNKNKTWPTGTNLLTAHQARAMLEHVLAGWRQVAWLHSVVQGDDNEPDQALSFAPDNFPLMGDAPHLFRSVGCVPLYAPALEARPVVHLDLCASGDDTMANYPNCDCAAAPAAVQTKGKDDSPSGRRCVVTIYGRAVDVVALYLGRGFTVLPPQLTMTGADMRRLGDVPAAYNLVRAVGDYAQFIGDSEACRVNDGDEFIAVPRAFPDGDSPKPASEHDKRVYGRIADNYFASLAAPQTAAPAAQPEPVAMQVEQALIELVDKIVPGLDSGDLLADARTASKRLDIPATQSEPVAWMTDDGRVISAAQKASALRDGGASASSVAPYSIPTYSAAPPPAAQSDEARDSKRFAGLLSLLHWDGHGYWLEDLCVKERERLEEFTPEPTMDELRAAIDATIAQKGAEHG